MTGIEKINGFLKDAKVYFLATNDNGQPRVRPFGTVNIFEGKLYIQTGKAKDVTKQILADPRVEISAFLNGDWIRLTGTLVEDNRLEVQESMLSAYPELSAMYKAGDGNTETFYFDKGKAVFCSFTSAPEIVEF